MLMRRIHNSIWPFPLMTFSDFSIWMQITIRVWSERDSENLARSERKLTQPPAQPMLAPNDSSSCLGLAATKSSPGFNGHKLAIRCTPPASEGRLSIAALTIGIIVGHVISLCVLNQISPCPCFGTTLTTLNCRCIQFMYSRGTLFH